MSDCWGVCVPWAGGPLGRVSLLLLAEGGREEWTAQPAPTHSLTSFCFPGLEGQLSQLDSPVFRLP